MAGRTTRASELGLVAVTIEGGMIAPEQVQKIASAERNAKLAASYESPKGTNLGDEIARYFRIGQALWKDYSTISSPTITRTAEFAHDLLTQCFGFDDLVGPVDHEEGNRRYRIAREAKQGRVPIVVASATDDRDAFNVALAEFGDGAAGSRQRRSPASLLQDWLNANPSFYWGLVFAGDRVRLMRDNDSLTRPAWIEADLGAMFRDEMFADFTIWWLLTHASRFGAAGAPGSECALEEWRAEGLKQGTAAREMLRGGVETALAELGQGVLEANPELRNRLQDQGALTALFQELLRTVYRLIFLAVAEDRDLLHPRRTGQEARALYADSYSFSFWRERSRRRAARDKHHDAWEAMKITFASLERGEELLGLPALGGLFAGGATPVLTAAKISNRRFLEAMFNLGYLIKNKVTHRINWRDLKTEELGSVYESLLEIRPQLTPAGQFELDAGAKGNARKTSGSYYTPDSLVETLLDSALTPVLNRAEVSADTSEAKVAAILDLRIIDPACGSGHFLLGAARRMADRVAKLRDEDAGKAETQAALRDVVSRCIHGVDRNPMAVELARVALWIESVSPGQPLSFLDANIRCGDALLGVFSLDALEKGVPDAAYKPLTGDDKATANGLKKLNKAERERGLLRTTIKPDKLIRAFDRLHTMPQNSVAEVRAVEHAYQAIKGDPDWREVAKACDAYVAAFLLLKPALLSPQAKPLVPTTRNVREALDHRPPQGELAIAINVAATAASVFHWPLEFPDVILGRGGFDAVLGNPPWERIKLQEQEFFAGTAVADAPNAAARGRMIEALRCAATGTPDRELFNAFQVAKRITEVSSVFARVPADEGGRFTLTGTGDVNTYALFSELCLNLTRNTGRAGVIVPTGIVTDLTTSAFFAHLVDNNRLVSSLGFDNAKRIFPAVHPDTPFCLLTTGFADAPPLFTSYILSVNELEDDRRRYVLNAAEITRINPNTKTAPVFRTREDARLTAAIYDRVPVLIDESKSSATNPWKAQFFTRIWHMAEDSSWFRTAAQLIDEGWQIDGSNWIRPASGLESSSSNAVAEISRTRYVPLYEAKMIHQFDHRWSTYDSLDGNVVSRDVTLAEKIDKNAESVPRYWVPEPEVSHRLSNKNWPFGWLMGWRNITNATNERTLIATIFPRTAAGNSLPLVMPIAEPRLSAALAANFSTLVVDFCERGKLGGTNLTFQFLFQLPILPPSAYAAHDLEFIVPRVLELTYTSHAMAPFARDVGYGGEPFGWDEDRRAELRAELDAWYALAYGLNRDELRYVLDPKDVMGIDYPSETFRVLQKNEIAKYGEYRTRRLVLAAYDALIAQGRLPRVGGYL